MSQWKEKIETMKHYDRQAKIYNIQYLEEQKIKIEEILKNIKFSQNDQIIDIGCGTGFLFDHFTQSVKFIVGIELSINAIREAKKRLINTPNIALIRADADYTPFPNRIFDKVIAISVLQNMPNNLKTIREMKRIGKLETVFALTGLKKKFNQESFLNLLKNADLNIIKLTNNQKLKGYVALCKKKKSQTVDFI